MRNGRKNPEETRWRKTTPGAGARREEIRSHVLKGQEKPHQLCIHSQLGEGEVFPPERRGSYIIPSSHGVWRPTKRRGRAEEKALIDEQLKSPELRPLVCLIEARGRGLMRSTRDGEMRAGTKMRALLSAIASGRAEIDRLGLPCGVGDGHKRSPDGPEADCE